MYVVILIFLSIDNCLCLSDCLRKIIKIIWIFAPKMKEQFCQPVKIKTSLLKEIGIIKKIAKNR